MKDFVLPLLEENESFSYEYWRDEDGIPEAVGFKFTRVVGLEKFEITHVVGVEEIETCRFDILRSRIGEKLALLRAASKDE